MFEMHEHTLTRMNLTNYRLLAAYNKKYREETRIAPQFTVGILLVCGAVSYLYGVYIIHAITNRSSDYQYIFNFGDRKQAAQIHIFKLT